MKGNERIYKERQKDIERENYPNEESDNEFKQENEVENDGDKIDENSDSKNERFNKDTVNINTINPSGKNPNKDQKKEKKEYSNFIQNIKKANKNKKNKFFINPEPKNKFVKAVNKIKVLKTVPQQKKNQIEDPLIGHVRAELLKENDEEKENLESKELESNKEENIKNEDKEIKTKTGYTGFVLSKIENGENIFQIKFEGSPNDINKIFKEYKIELEEGPVELIYTKDLENLRKKNEEKKEYEKKKESRMQNPIFTAVKNKTVDAEIAKIEDDNMKIKEMKENIQKYKEVLKKENDDIGIGIPKEKKKGGLSYLKKFKGLIGKRLVESAMKKYTTNYQTENNRGEGPDKKQNFKKIENDSKKDKEKSYSRAMDRFKKRYKKEKSVEVRSKKSQKINEIARNLENVIGNRNNSTEIRYEEKVSNAIIYD